MPDKDVVKALKGVEQADYTGDYHSHLLEQYKLFVEMTDKISERRHSANNFFLTINSALVAAFGLSVPHLKDTIGDYWVVFVSVLGVLLCVSWYHLIRSYRCLNDGRFEVIHEIEKMLPIRPYAAEWVAVGEGEKSLLYRPFTHIEHNIPTIFLVFYAVVGLSVLRKL